MIPSDGLVKGGKSDMVFTACFIKCTLINLFLAWDLNFNYIYEKKPRAIYIRLLNLKNKLKILNYIAMIFKCIAKKTRGQ